MNKKILGYLLLVFALVFQLAAPMQAGAAETDLQAGWKGPVNYLALGDSLAFGIQSDGMPGKSYADFLSEKFAGQDTAFAGNKGFSFPGYTSGNVLSDLQNNVTKPVLGTGSTGQTKSLHEAVKEADLITVTAGANDVLPHFKLDEAGNPAFDLNQIQASIMQAGKNMHAILAAIYELNPKAQVYVMGYYNSFPHLQAELQPQLTQLVKGLNGAIQGGMQGTPARFVPTEELIAKDFAAYVPNPANIHLSEAGYRAVADAFYESVRNTFESGQPPVKPVLPFTDLGDSWANEFIAKAVASGMMSGYDDQTFRPGKPLTRAQAASVIVRALDLKPKSTVMPFKDMKHYAAETQADIQAAHDHGLMAGVNGNFLPNKPITRAQLALLLSRAYETAAGESLKAASALPFKDIQKYAKDTQQAIAGLYQLGIVSGDQGKFMPNKPTTRAQASKMIVQTMEAVTQ